MEGLQIQIGDILIGKSPNYTSYYRVQVFKNGLFHVIELNKRILFQIETKLVHILSPYEEEVGGLLPVRFGHDGQLHVRMQVLESYVAGKRYCDKVKSE